MDHDDDAESQNRDLDSIEFVSHSSSDNEGESSGNEEEVEETMDEDSELSNSLDYYEDIEDDEMATASAIKKKNSSLASEKRKKASNDGMDFDDDFLAQAVAKKKQKQQQSSERGPSLLSSLTNNNHHPAHSDTGLMTDSRANLALEVTRAKHTLNQHYFWDQVVGVRLGLQPAMSAVTLLPLKPSSERENDEKETNPGEVAATRFGARFVLSFYSCECLLLFYSLFPFL